jgi:hypothetical protein
MPGSDGVVTELWRYPVKSFRGEQLDEVLLDARGVAGDRAFAVRDANGKFGSGKTTRRFRLLRDRLDFAAETDSDGVVVRAPGGASFRVGDADLDSLLSARYGERLEVVPEAAVSHFDAGPTRMGCAPPAASSPSWSSGTNRCSGSTRTSPHRERSG